MTIAARISQDDMKRAAKAVRAAGIERARIIMRLEKAEIEIIIGKEESPPEGDDGWDDDDE